MQTKKTEIKENVATRNCQNNEIIWSINFEINDGHADPDLGSSPTSTTTYITVAATAMSC